MAGDGSAERTGASTEQGMTCREIVRLVKNYMGITDSPPDYTAVALRGLAAQRRPPVCCPSGPRRVAAARVGLIHRSVGRSHRRSALRSDGPTRPIACPMLRCVGPMRAKLTRCASQLQQQPLRVGGWRWVGRGASIRLDGWRLLWLRRQPSSSEVDSALGERRYGHAANGR